MIDHQEAAPPNSDFALKEVAEEIKRLDPDGSRWAAVVRHTYDVIYNGQETGRYKWDQLMKTEKTHFGTLFEINAQREFKFDGGDKTDYLIVGHQVDAKWSQNLWGWMLPPEVFDELALVATASDQESIWSLGLIRISTDNRRKTSNRDQKSQLNLQGRSAVHWLWKDAPLRPNVLLQLSNETVGHIFDNRFGTQRTHRLFRAAEGMIVHRNTVATVSRQLDPQKRVRANGGSRTVLAPEGFVILSGQYHRAIARDLAVPVPRSDEYISVKVVPSEDGSGAPIEGRYWRRALSGEEVVVSAPILSEPRTNTD